MAVNSLLLLRRSLNLNLLSYSSSRSRCSTMLNRLCNFQALSSSSSHHQIINNVNTLSTAQCNTHSSSMFSPHLNLNLSRPMSSKSPSPCRQNFHHDCEAGLNKQINEELYASFVYLSMAFHFDRDDVALRGFHKFFKEASSEEREHADQLMTYQNARGGRILMKPINKPEKDDWGSPAEAVNAALELERKLNQDLLDLHQLASKHGDAHLEDFLEAALAEQVKAIKLLADYASRLRRVGVGLGEYVFDREEFEGKE